MSEELHQLLENMDLDARSRNPKISEREREQARITLGYRLILHNQLKHYGRPCQ